MTLANMLAATTRMNQLKRREMNCLTASLRLTGLF
jgi:hypothetical protein